MMILILFVLLIVLFLKGMSMLRKGLISLTFEKIEKRLLFFTDHPVKAFLVSIIFTGILQSSSAFMVIVIGFVSVGALSFKRSIPLILGTNIGSTFTTEFLAVKLEFLIFALLAAGAGSFHCRKIPFSASRRKHDRLGGYFFLYQRFQPACRAVVTARLGRLYRAACRRFIALRFVHRHRFDRDDSFQFGVCRHPDELYGSRCRRIDRSDERCSWLQHRDMHYGRDGILQRRSLQPGKQLMPMFCLMSLV